MQKRCVRRFYLLRIAHTRTTGPCDDVLCRLLCATTWLKLQQKKILYLLANKNARNGIHLMFNRNDDMHNRLISINDADNGDGCSKYIKWRTQKMRAGCSSSAVNKNEIYSASWSIQILCNTYLFRRDKIDKDIKHTVESSKNVLITFYCFEKIK